MTPEAFGQEIHLGQVDPGRSVAALSTFLAAGGDVNAVEPRSGMPLLHFACEHQDIDVIRGLIAAGADINLVDASGQAPLHIAVDIDIDAVVQTGGKELLFATTRVLLELGADASLRDFSGRTPRDLAENCGAYALQEFDRRTAAVRHVDVPGQSSH